MGHTQLQVMRLSGIACVILMMDALITYLMRSAFGFAVPPNAFTCALAAGAFALSLRGEGSLPITWLALLFFGLTGFLIGVLAFGELTLGRVTQIVSPFLAFIAGFLWLTEKTRRAENDWVWACYSISLLYALVCVLALSTAFPGYFPVVETRWSLNGDLISRPEVMTDQNFQVFYLLGTALPLVYGLTARVLVPVAMGVGLSGWVLVSLQTRSGVIVYGGVVLAAALIGFCRHRTRMGILLVGLGALIVLYSLAEFALQVSAPLIARFSTHEGGGLGGRLLSAEYLLQNIVNIEWWVPQGNADFKRLHGDLPHFTPTAFFLEGGVVGIIFWILALLWPLVQLSAIRFRRLTTVSEDAVLVLNGACCVTSLTLNVPFLELLWLWSGATVACVVSSRSVLRAGSNASLEAAGSCQFSPPNGLMR